MVQTTNAQTDPNSPETPLIIGGPAPVENPVEQPVAPLQPEQAPEQAVEQPAPAQPAPVEVAPVAPPAPEAAPAAEAPPAPPVREKTQEEKRIDEILSAELEDVIVLLQGKVQEDFIKKGNETVVAIAKILFEDKTTEKDLLKLVQYWFNEAKGLDDPYIQQEVPRKVGKLWEYRREKRSEE